MTDLLTIGELARRTHLSVRTLRHYHEVGLIVPVAVDAWSGYRRYSTAQVPVAHLVRRLRDLDMPVPEIREALAAGPEARSALLAAHLRRMEDELDRTREVVRSLRMLLDEPVATIPVEVRVVPAAPAFVVEGRAEHARIADWCGAAFADLDRMVAAAGVEPVGAGGALYSQEYFEEGVGEVRAYVAVSPGDGAAGAAGPGALREVPGGRYAVALHEGPFTDLDRTYGALGAHVGERGIGEAGPIREHYLVSPGDASNPADWRTEVCWPIGPPTPTGA